MSYEEIREQVAKGNAPKVKELTEAALAQGTPPQEILQEGLIPAMDTVGEKFQAGEIFVSEMMIAARAMYASLDLIKPLLATQQSVTKGKAIVGTVKGDLHDIGKNLVAMLMEGGGYEVVDLGINVPPSKFVDAIREQNPDIVLLSALLTTTMPAMEETIRAIEAAGLRGSIAIGVGGAPVTQEFAERIGADFYAPDASAAVSQANRVLAGS